uniref:Uncharacterized protein n=1 Tax=Anopheles maculatus TaxID=74869 RepID=A0A182SZU5_9DIPT
MTTTLSLFKFVIPSVVFSVANVGPQLAKTGTNSAAQYGTGPRSLSVGCDACVSQVFLPLWNCFYGAANFYAFQGPKRMDAVKMRAGYGEVAGSLLGVAILSTGYCNSPTQ